MPFQSGSISFRRYAVVGQSPKLPDEAMLESLAGSAFRESDIGLPLAVEYGWVGARHVLDAAFDFESSVFNDCLHFGLRVDTNKVPASLVKAWLELEYQAAAKDNPSGFISKMQKKLAKDAVDRKSDEELRTGKHRRSKLVPILWDVPAGIVYGPSGAGDREKLTEIFERTFNLELHPLSSGMVAGRKLEHLGKRREYEDFVPTRFVLSTEDADMPAEYPWTAKGDGAKDFLGNEFLLWLWHEGQTGGSIATPSGDVSILFDRTLQLECVFGQTGRDTLAAAGPTKMPEAIEALASGKVPRKAGLIIDAPVGQFTLSIAGETLAISTLKLPEIEKADSLRSLFEERITLLRDFSAVLDALYAAFLAVRTTGWAAVESDISEWIAKVSN